MQQIEDIHDLKSEVSDSPAFDEDTDGDQVRKVEPVIHAQTEETAASTSQEREVADASVDDQVKPVASTANTRTEACTTTDKTNVNSSGFRLFVGEEQPLASPHILTQTVTKSNRSKNTSENNPPKKARRKAQTAKPSKARGIPAGQMHNWILPQRDDDGTSSNRLPSDELMGSASSSESATPSAQITYLSESTNVSPLLVSPARSSDPTPLPALSLDLESFPNIAAMGQYPTLYAPETAQQARDRVTFREYKEYDFMKLADDDPETFLRVTVPYLYLKKSANDFMLFKAWFTKYEASHPGLKDMTVDSEVHPSKRASNAWERLNQYCKDEWTVASRRVSAMHPVRYPILPLLSPPMQKKIEAVYVAVNGVPPPKPDNYRPPQNKAKADENVNGVGRGTKRERSEEENAEARVTVPKRRRTP
ncbi:hypothetical protein EST38_g2248 [Candolleomyces aberdarensis]|uniref:Uncharacterized protein n=1 Tax=Candolleomyces aberdarensis TaxID=2316362 RepID=A0A4Q2DTY6_9AGAR|nr:hypothetical protein EST38_g2248 [Candolleomyces aberdarensis]